METIKVSNIDELQDAVYKHPGSTIELKARTGIDVRSKDLSMSITDYSQVDWSTWRPTRKPLARAIAATITTEKDVMWNDFLNRGVSCMKSILAKEIRQEDIELIERLKAVHDDPKTSKDDKDQARCHTEALGGEV